MGHRTLSREECDAFTSEAIAFMYKNIIGQYYSPEVIEKTLLQAVLIVRNSQCKLDAEVLAFLFERICESDDILNLETGGGELGSSYKYC